MNVTENALTNMKNILTDIRTQCVNGSTDTLTSDDRQTILDNLKALSEQVYSEGNAEYAGKSVFTGYRTSDTLTFQKDEPETTYEIEQKFDYRNLEETRYYTAACFAASHSFSVSYVVTFVATVCVSPLSST